MTEIVEPMGEVTRRNFRQRRPTLTRDAMFRLWRAAIKDDDKVADEVIQKVYDDMMAFDRERADGVIELMVRRNPAAGIAFRALLTDMQQRAAPIALAAMRAA
jgi:hypothetical protein